MPSDDLDQSDVVRVVVLSGPSGSGKTTIVKRLLDLAPLPLMTSVSATTRLPRVGEVDGVDYHFLTHAQFEQRRLDGEFVEYAAVHGTGQFYGTWWPAIEKARSAGAWALLEIDVNGALQVMEQYPSAITIFLRTPSAEVFEQRLRSRGTESSDVIARRLRTARNELVCADRYRFQVVNDDLDRAVAEITKILRTEEKQANA